MRQSLILLTAAALGGCFSPEVSAGDGTEDGSTSPSSSGPGGGTSGDETGTPTTGGPETSTTSTNPTGEVTTDTDPGTDTAIGGECDSSSDCAAGVCVEMECVPCGDAPDPDAACADADGALPFCGDDGTCIACTPSSCGDATPACNPAAGCMACTEHSQCPDSACHLGGPAQGSCFDPNDVIEVSSSDELSTAIDALTPGTQRVLRFAPGEYSTLVVIGPDEEVALIGGPSVTLRDGATNLIYHNGGLLYLAGFAIENGPQRAIHVGGGAELWLDDVSIEGYSQALHVLDGEARIRRSQFRGTNGDIFATVGVGEDGLLIAENTEFGPQGNPAVSIYGDVDFRYVTIAGNTAGVECGPNAAGQIRNSILVNPTDTNAGGCGDNTLSYVDNATDAFPFGQDVGEFDDGWFTVSDGSRFQLSAAGQGVFADIADWDEGDPTFDIDGTARPTRERGFPGVDEPE